LELLVQIGVAGGAGHGLVQGLELGLGALDAGGLGLVQRAALLQAGHGLQGKEQQEAEGGRHGQLAAEPGAAFEQRIVGAELSGDLEQRQAEQREGGGFDQGSTNSTSATTRSPGAEKSTGLLEREESELGGMAELR
jgi:hypothetical protein